MGEPAGAGVGIQYCAHSCVVDALDSWPGPVLVPLVELVGRRIQLKLELSANELAGRVGVVVAGGVVTGVFAGVFVGVCVGVFVGEFVGVELVGVGFMVAGGLAGGAHQPVDRRARPSSGSTEIDACLLNRRAVTRWWLCSRCSLIVLFLAKCLLVLQSPH
jgi:hypothetical protein